MIFYIRETLEKRYTEKIKRYGEKIFFRHINFGMVGMVVVII